MPGACGVWQGPATGLQLRPDPGVLGQMGEWEGRGGVYPSSLAALLTNSWREMVSLGGGGEMGEERNAVEEQIGTTEMLKMD